MVKADTRALNLLLPKDLSEWFTDYAKSLGKTKTEIICSLLQEIKNGNAYSDVDNPVDNSVDGIESIVKAYLDKHLQIYIDNYLHGAKQADVVNPVDSDKDVYVDTDVVNPVDESNPLPITTATDEAPSIEKSLDSETLSDVIAATAKPKSSKRSAKSKAILTRPEALAIAQKLGFTGTGQNLYDWAKAALIGKTDESRLANAQKLADVGLVAVFTPEKKPSWKAKS